MFLGLGGGGVGGFVFNQVKDFIILLYHLINAIVPKLRQLNLAGKLRIMLSLSIVI